MANLSFLPADHFSEQPYYDTSSFWCYTAGATVAFPLVRFVLNRWLLQGLARSVLLDKSQRNLQNLPPKVQSKVNKFTESTWKLLVYAGLELFGWYALYDKNWLWNTANCWADIPYQLQSKRVQELYMLQFGFYISSLYMLNFWETKRSDYPVMFMHHLTALSLIWISHTFGYQRVGSVILLLHDCSDILLELAKVLNYAKQELLSTICFVSMMASWFFLRLVIFPRYIVYSTWIESVRILGHPLVFHKGIVALLLALQVMHIYWFALIVRVAARVVSKSENKDVREDED